ncbi:hypothetical protein MtrunA17_Chr7g0232771 [Medicago truncatula]|uniref:Uncharacterized protein n=1 Tax=Medicago truncatula TaxID=3880 RepID=A0A396GZD0_MEDTR|nr:hypothetical protein MtrunA17_Chr7g0232771 [Medicago truncatula]
MERKTNANPLQILSNVPVHQQLMKVHSACAKFGSLSQLESS